MGLLEVTVGVLVGSTLKRNATWALALQQRPDDSPACRCAWVSSGCRVRLRAGRLLRG
jgi:hypothetical protein